MHALALPCFFVCFIVLNQAYGLARQKRASATKLLELTQNCRILNEDFLKLVLKNRANKSVQILNESVDFFFFRTFFFFEYAKQRKRKYKSKTNISKIKTILIYYCAHHPADDTKKFLNFFLPLLEFFGVIVYN